MSELTEFAMILILEDRLDEAQECLLVESMENDMLQSIGEVSVFDYLLKIEKFFDQRDLYLYKGWENAQVLSHPKVDKFWVSLDLRVPKDTELNGAHRCTSSDEDQQNTSKYKELEDGSFYVRFKILRRILDKIEMDNKDKAEEIADRESGV